MEVEAMAAVATAFVGERGTQGVALRERHSDRGTQIEAVRERQCVPVRHSDRGTQIEDVRERHFARDIQS
jgi:lipase chaperone LimK